MSTAAAPVLPAAPARAGLKHPRLDSLQVFRGVASLLVVLHHAGTFANGHLGGPFVGNRLDWGASGVDFFFVLSGFIIFFVHRRDLGKPEALRGFAVKRLIRIYPIYWVACLLVIPLYFLSPASGPVYARDPVAIATSVLLIPQAHFPVLAVAWTLTFELLFYAIFALLIWRFRLFAPVVVLWLGACAGIYGWQLLRFFGGSSDGMEHLVYPWNWLFSRHNVLFGFGIASAAVVMSGRREVWYQVSLAAGLLLFAGCALLNQPGSTPAFVRALDYPLTFGVASALVVIGAAGLDLTRPHWRMPAFLLYLGNASYSIYLFHGVAMSLAVRPAERLVASHRLGVNAAALAMCVVAVAVGCVVHSFVERPLLDVLRRRLVRRTASVA